MHRGGWAWPRPSAPGWPTSGERSSGLRGHANVVRYLAGNMIYTDGLVALFAFGGIYAAGTFGWSSIELGLFGILLTITGTIGALVGGWLDDRVGPKRVVIGALVVLMLSSAGILSVDRDHVALRLRGDAAGGGRRAVRLGRREGLSRPRGGDRGDGGAVAGGEPDADGARSARASG